MVPYSLLINVAKTSKHLLVLGDPYNMKHDLTDIVPHQYKPCGKKCDWYDYFVASQSYVISNATGRKYYIRRNSTCSAPNVVYTAYCKNVKSKVLCPQFHVNHDYVTTSYQEECSFWQDYNLFYW